MYTYLTASEPFVYKSEAAGDAYWLFILGGGAGMTASGREHDTGQNVLQTSRQTGSSSNLSGDHC
jgi:hypothetical protein